MFRVYLDPEEPAFVGGLIVPVLKNRLFASRVGCRALMVVV